MPNRRRPPGAGDNRSLALDGEKVKARRIALGLSRDALSARSQKTPYSVATATIKRAENGTPIYLSNANSLSVLLEMPLSDLLAPNQSDGAFATQARPMIAVMPFQAGQGETASFVEGLAEDLITRLSRSWFPLIARPSSLAEPALDARSEAKVLGAKYWIDGSVRRAGMEIRVTAQIADVDTGAVVHRYSDEKPFADVFQLQHALSAAIVTELSRDLIATEAKRFEDRNPKDLDAWQQGLLGTWHFYLRTPADNASARALLGEALRRDRSMPLAWFNLALTHQQDLINQWSADPARSIANLGTVAKEFERLYPDEAGAQIAHAYLDVYQGQRESAMTRLTAAIEIDPNAPLAYTLYGQTLAMAHEPEQALEQFDVALRLNPKDTERWSTYVGISLAHFVAEQYLESIAAAHEAARVRPSAAFPYSTLASAHAWLGNLPEANEALATMLHLQPTLSARGISSVMGSTDKDIGKRYLEGLRRAGLRE